MFINASKVKLFEILINFLDTKIKIKKSLDYLNIMKHEMIAQHVENNFEKLTSSF